MASNINICLIGETSCGKTTLASVILNQIAGEIKMRRSTLNYTCFSENDSISEEQSDIVFCDGNIKCTYTNIKPTQFFGSSDRNCRFNVYDSVGFNDIDIGEENAKFLEKNVLPKLDILIVVLDVTKCLSTKSELLLLEKVNKYECKKFFVINKVDDMADQELTENIKAMTDFLITKKMCIGSDIILVGAKNLYDTIFQTKNYVCLELLYKSRENILDTFGYNKLGRTISDYCDGNIKTIYSRKLYHATSTCTSLTDLHNIYNKCHGLLNGNIDRFITYLQKVKFNEKVFDANIKDWIHEIDFNSMDHIFGNYCSSSAGNTIDDIYNKFGNNISTLTFLIRNLDYENNRKLFFDILNNNGELLDQKVNAHIDIILSRVNNILLQHIKIAKGPNKVNDRDIYLTYLTLKTMSENFGYVRKFPSLGKMKLININNSNINDLVIEDDIELEIMVHHLYELCSLFFQKKNDKEIIIKKLLDENFVIFPCDNYGSPLEQGWRDYDNEHSRVMYCKSNKSFVDFNIGLICNSNSKIMAVKIYDDVSLNYWKELDKMSEDTLNFKIRGVSYYIYKWDSEIVEHFSVNNKIYRSYNNFNIDLIFNSYIAVDLKKIGECTKDCKNIRDIIGCIPECLMDMIKNVDVTKIIEKMSKEKEKHKNDILENWVTIKNIPDEMLDQDLCNLAVSIDCAAMMWVPDKFKSIELCKRALQGWGDFVRDHKNMDFMEMYRIAVKKDWTALCCAPNNLKTKEICILAFADYDCNPSKLVCYIPEKFLTLDFYESIVTKNRYSLTCVPKNVLTYKLCKSAVFHFPDALRYVHDNFKTKELCELAVVNNGTMLKYVPANLKTEELCKLAVSKDGSALEFVPANIKTKKLCRLAVSKHSYAFNFVPDNLQTDELKKMFYYNF